MQEYTEADVQNALEQVAFFQNTTVDQVRRNIMEAFEETWKTAGPKEMAIWNEIPCRGDVPSPEEVMLYVLDRIVTH